VVFDIVEGYEVKVLCRIIHYFYSLNASYLQLLEYQSLVLTDISAHSHVINSHLTLSS